MTATWDTWVGSNHTDVTSERFAMALNDTTVLLFGRYPPRDVQITEQVKNLIQDVSAFPPSFWSWQLDQTSQSQSLEQLRQLWFSLKMAILHSVTLNFEIDIVEKSEEVDRIIYDIEKFEVSSAVPLVDS
jgi:hypothetical protein